MNGKIEYGFGREYLSSWTLKEALREVFQNYIDYGDYDISIGNVDEDNNSVTVRVANDYY
jgi:hypothetical protein